MRLRWGEERSLVKWPEERASGLAPARGPGRRRTGGEAVSAAGRPDRPPGAGLRSAVPGGAAQGRDGGAAVAGVPARAPRRRLRVLTLLRPVPGVARQLDVAMRQEHRAGEELFADWAGMTMTITDPATGEETEEQVFVATLGASNFTYAEVFATQELRHWVAGHVHAHEYMRASRRSPARTTRRRP